MHGEGSMVVIVAGYFLAAVFGLGFVTGLASVLQQSPIDRERVRHDLASAQKKLWLVGIVAAALFGFTVALMSLLVDSNPTIELLRVACWVSIGAFLVALAVFGIVCGRALRLARMLAPDTKPDAA